MRNVFGAILVVCAVTIMFSACSATGPGSSSFPNVVEISGCLERDGSDPDAVYSCIEYDYADGVLSILHTNTCFNCCPQDWGGLVSIEDRVITIEEVEGVGQCDCHCLFDIEYRIENLEPGEYDLIIQEMYPSTGAISFDVELDFTLPDSAEICLERHGYPWE
ncbi:hypothetical protein H8E52_07930 [bacterium]|nr:hypothetical protein [bacterium]